MATRESEDYKLFRKNIITPRDRCDRIENIMVVGMPDVNCCIDKVECWIELKSPIEPKRESTKLFGSNHKLSQDQKNWFLRQKNAGGVAFVLIATDKRWILISGHDADYVNEMTVNELIDISVWHSIKPIRGKEKWNKLRESLKHSHSSTS